MFNSSSSNADYGMGLSLCLWIGFFILAMVRWAGVKL